MRRCLVNQLRNEILERSKTKCCLLASIKAQVTRYIYKIFFFFLGAICNRYSFGPSCGFSSLAYVRVRNQLDSICRCISCRVSHRSCPNVSAIFKRLQLCCVTWKINWKCARTVIMHRQADDEWQQPLQRSTPSPPAPPQAAPSAFGFADSRGLSFHEPRHRRHTTKKKKTSND